MDIKFVKKHEEAILPKKNHEDPLTGDAGYDIFIVEDVLLKAGQAAEVNVGLEVGFITPGYWFKIEGRSGLGFKRGVTPHYGVIDNSYRGKLGIKLYNKSSEDVILPKGSAVAQMIVYKMIDCTMSWTDTHAEGARGRNGFGSSDYKGGK